MNSYLTYDKNIEILKDQVLNKIQTLNEIDDEIVDFYYSIKNSVIEISLPASDTYYGNGKYNSECDEVEKFITRELGIVSDELYWFDSQSEGYDQEPYWYIRIYWDDEDYDDEPYNKNIFK